MDTTADDSNQIRNPALRLTRIIATIGPACSDLNTLHGLISAGMDIARLNLSHGTRQEHEEICMRIRLVSREIGRLVGIIIDIPGPKLRVRSFPETGNIFYPGQIVNLSADPDKDEIGVSPISHIPFVQPNDIILVGDGAVTMKVICQDTVIKAEVTGGGSIRNGAGVVFPGRRPDIPYLNDLIKKDLTFAITLDPDFIALSFVSCADNVHDARAYLADIGVKIPIIAKIETGLAVENFDEILAVSDGIMIARGDLGVELPIESVPHIQKSLIKKCYHAGKPVITATEMLESMVHHCRPTRAEVTDVANAIADGTDATMLSEETSIGDNPVQSVIMMNAIAREIEKHLPYQQMLADRRVWNKRSSGEVISYSACYLVNELRGKSIIAFTRSGLTAVRVSRCRPATPIFAITADETIARRLLLQWGVFPYLHDPISSADELFTVSCDLVTSKKLAKSGDILVIIAGNFGGEEGKTNMIKVQTVP